MFVGTCVYPTPVSIDLFYYGLRSLIDFIKDSPNLLSDNAQHDDHEAE